MVTARRGKGQLGCLVGALLLVTIAYFGYNIGEVYLRFYRYRDAMMQEARFAHNRSDDAIRARLTAVADSLELPEAAGRISVQRESARIIIRASYWEHIELPLFVREFYFAPQVVRTF